jgi:hypothetical protein
MVRRSLTLAARLYMRVSQIRDMDIVAQAGTVDPIVVRSNLFLAGRGMSEKWLHNFRQWDEWNLCLTAGTVVPANQERP